MVAGGVTASPDLEFSVVRTVEVLDVQRMTWRRAMDIPASITGSRLVVVDGRPCLVGRYGALGSSPTRALLRYSEQNTWLHLPVQLVEGRSDYQIIRDLPSTVRSGPSPITSALTSFLRFSTFNKLSSFALI